jgi:outer membrane protein TolC
MAGAAILIPSLNTTTPVAFNESDYFLLRDLDLQLQITRETVRTQEDSVKLIKLRLQHGVAATLDVLQARQVLDTANSELLEKLDLKDQRNKAVRAAEEMDE